MTCSRCGRDVTLLSGGLCGHCTGDVWREAPTFHRFLLYRSEDESGVSGEGTVAVGVIFPDGGVAMQWLNGENENLDTSQNGWALYPGPDGVEDARKVHGHGGRTELVIEGEGHREKPEFEGKTAFKGDFRGDS